MGDRLANLRSGVAAMASLLDALRCSPVYESEPVGPVDQAPFLNACCAGLTTLLAPDLLERLQQIERAAGRRPGGRRYGPRELDLDILLYGEDIVDLPGLRIPHPRLAERAFALVPLRDVAPEWRHPALDASIAELAARADASGVHGTTLRLWGDPPVEAEGEEGARG